MKPFTKFIVLIIILALGLIAVFSIQKKNQSLQRQTRTTQTSPMFAGLDETRIFRIEISSLQKQSLLLRKEAGVWQVSKGRDVMGALMRQSEANQNSAAEGENAIQPENPADDMGPSGDMFRTFYNADPDKVDTLIKSFIDLPRGQLITSNPDKHTQFKVLNTVVGSEVIFYDEQMNKIAALFIGDAGSAFTSTYVRKPEENDVYEVPGNLKMIFETDLVSLRDRKIFSAAPETITSVVIDDFVGTNSMSLSREEGSWVGTDGTGANLALDPARVDDLLSALGSLSANSFVDQTRPATPPAGEEATWDPDNQWGLGNPTATIMFVTSDNAVHKLILGRSEGTTYYAATENDPNSVFKISSSSLEAIIMDPANLAPGAEPISAEGTPDAAVINNRELERTEFEPGTPVPYTPPPAEEGGEGGE